MEELEQRIAAVKASAASPLTEGAAGLRLEREVDFLLHQFYDDIGTLKLVSLRSIFDLFLIKVMVIGRGQRDMPVLEYLSDMLNRFLLTRELAHFSAQHDFLYTLLEEIKDRTRFQNLFEASRQMADNALFVTGIFPPGQHGRRRRGMPRPLRFDREHFIEAGRRYYLVAAEEELAAVVGQRDVLLRLGQHFREYVTTLNELSRRFILGFDMELIANKMLDALNLYRRTGDQAHLVTAGRYAALLKVDRSFHTARPRFRGPVIDLGALGS